MILNARNEYYAFFLLFVIMDGMAGDSHDIVAGGRSETVRQPP